MVNTGITRSCFNFLILKVLMGWELCLPSFTSHSQVTCRDDEKPFPYRLHEFFCHLQYCSFGYHQSCGTSTGLKVKHRTLPLAQKMPGCLASNAIWHSGNLTDKERSNQTGSRGKKPSHDTTDCLLLFLKLPYFNLLYLYEE